MKKLQVNETLLSDETTTRIITFIDYYDYEFSDVNLECKYFLLMLDQLFGTASTKTNNSKNGLT